MLGRRLLSRARGRRASCWSAARSPRTGSWGRVGCGGAEGQVAQTHQDFQLAPLQRLVQVARAREGEFLQELREASFDHRDQAEPPNSASRPPTAAPARVPRSLAWPGLAARAQTSRARPGLPGSRLPARRRWGPAPGAERSGLPGCTRRTWPRPGGGQRASLRSLRARAVSQSCPILRITWSEGWGGSGRADAC